jgi:hypothetical protein
MQLKEAEAIQATLSETRHRMQAFMKAKRHTGK